MLAEIVARRADQIANIFNEQQAGAVEAEVVEVTLNHAGVEMAGAAGDDLANGKTEAGETPGVVVCL